MRMILGAFWSLAALLIAAPALAASTTTTTQTHTIAQPIHAMPVALCMPAPGAGDIVVIPGVPNFRALSVAASTGSAAMQMQPGMSAERVEHGFIMITKQIDAASPKFVNMVENHAVIPTITITMRKASGQTPAVWTLSNASITGIKHSSPTLETVVFQYQTLSECSPQPTDK
jgi:hypothetical protein